MWLLKYLLVQWHWKEFSYCLPQCGIAFISMMYIYSTYTIFWRRHWRFAWPSLLATPPSPRLVALLFTFSSFLFWDFLLGFFFFFDIIKSNFSIAFIGCFLVDFWFILGNFSLSRNIEQLLLWVPPYVCVCVCDCVFCSHCHCIIAQIDYILGEEQGEAQTEHSVAKPRHFLHFRAS